MALGTHEDTVLRTWGDSAFTIQDANNGNQNPFAQSWIGLLSATPSEGSQVEVTGGSYARVRVHHDGTTLPYWQDPVAGPNGEAIKRCNGPVQFPSPTATYTVYGVAIYDAQTGGNVRCATPLRDVAGVVLPNGKTVNSGDDPIILPDGLLEWVFENQFI